MSIQIIKVLKFKLRKQSQTYKQGPIISNYNVTNAMGDHLTINIKLKMSC
jgi:hypothetical protein